MSTPDSGETPLEQRVDRLESGQTSINEKVDLILSKLTGSSAPPVSREQAQQQTEDKLDRPSSMAEAVRAELARKEREDSEAADKKSVKDELAELRAKMTEKQPEPPQPRREKVMWGPR